MADAPFEKTTKAYKLFRAKKKAPGQLFPLFVRADEPVPMGEWVQAKAGLRAAKGKGVKSKIGNLAYRPGWHAGDLPLATHIGGKPKGSPRKMPPTFRRPEQIWAEVLMPDDVDWQSVANERGLNAKGQLVPKQAHITDQIPFGGNYRYKTNPNMTGNWLISGDMLVDRILQDDEVRAINEAAGVSDLPRLEPLDLERFGLEATPPRVPVADPAEIAIRQLRGAATNPGRLADALEGLRAGTASEPIEDVIRAVSGEKLGPTLRNVIEQMPDLALKGLRYASKAV